MKEAWKEEITAFERRTSQSVKKGDFAEVFGKAFQKAFTRDTIIAAFRATGVDPFNPSAVAKQKMLPSLATSSKATFPMPQTTPVRRVMAAFHYQPAEDLGVTLPRFQVPLEAIIEETTSGAQTPPQLSAAFGSMPTPSSIPSPISTTTSNIPDIDPSLFTPSKRATALRATLAESNSGSFLVGDARIASSQTILAPVLEQTSNLEQPDWALLKSQITSQTKEQMKAHIEALTESLRRAKILVAAKDSIIEASQAQLVIQNMHLNKLNETLQAKEGAKENDRTKLFPKGRGRLLTGDEFHEEQVNAEKERQAKEDEKKRRKQKQVDKRAQKNIVAERWKKALEEHAAEVEEWERKKKILRDQGILIKDLPKKPAKPKKGDIEAEVEREVGVEDDEDEDGDGDDCEFKGDGD